jgi:uncharacterized protein (DUF433 family)
LRRAISSDTDRDADVPDPDHPRIVADEVFGVELRISDRRVTVFDIYGQVKEGDHELSSEGFAETFQLAVADVYAALVYYRAQEEEMEHHREAREQAGADLRERIARGRPAGINPNE